MLKETFIKWTRTFARKNRKNHGGWMAGGILLLPVIAGAGSLSFGFNRPGNVLIADQFNNRVIRVDTNGNIVMSYGLPLAGGGAIGNNVGYDLHTTQKGLFSPYDAKIIGDYTGLTPPFDFEADAADGF